MRRSYRSPTGANPLTPTHPYGADAGPVQRMDYPGRHGGAHDRQMSDHADYCPISIGVEILGDRWTPLVIRELTVGASGFNEIHRGIPRVSRTLLSQRLRAMERRGLVTRTAGLPGRAGCYALTPAGAALAPVVWAMGHWAAEWAFEEPSEQSLDGLALVWRMHQSVAPERLPRERTLVHLVLSGSGGVQAWLEVGPEGATVCREDPGLDVALALQADNRAMHRWLFGLVDFRELERVGLARLLGPSALARAFPGWFDVSSFAEPLRRGESRQALTAAARS